MTDQSGLSSRAIMGMYYARLDVDPGLAWINDVANLFQSDQASETYKFLGQSPAMRKWLGGRQAKGLAENGLTIINDDYEATLEVSVKDARRDKTGQIRARMQDLADRSQSHWASLLSTLLLNGVTTLCYDGQFYFDIDHVEGDSTVQSNKISWDLSNTPASVHGTPTLPSVEEMQAAIVAGIGAILSFKDDRGEPMNENGRAFRVLTPISLWPPASAAMRSVTTSALLQNINPTLAQDLVVSVSPLPRLTWTDQIVVFRTDSPIKGLIRQTELDVEMKAKAEGSEFEFDNNAWQFGIDAARGVGYGYWQRACHVTLVP